MTRTREAHSGISEDGGPGETSSVFIEVCFDCIIGKRSGAVSFSQMSTVVNEQSSVGIWCESLVSTVCDFKIWYFHISRRFSK